MIVTVHETSEIRDLRTDDAELKRFVVQFTYLMDTNNKDNSPSDCSRPHDCSVRVN